MHFSRVLYILFLCLLSISSVNAQVSVQAGSASIGRYQISHLFDATLVNSASGQMENLTVQITLKNAAGKDVLKWVSDRFVCPTGFTAFEVIPLQVSRGRFEQGENYYRSNLFLPVGQYSAHYAVYANGPSGSALLGETHMEISSTEFPDILLISVEDGDTLTNKFPVFNWSSFVFPQLPQDGSGDFQVNYRIIIKQVFNEQSNLEAMEYNPTHHEQDGLNANTYVYPFNGLRFDDSAVYVWKVEARVNGLTISSSDIWRFVYSPKPPRIYNAPIIMLNPEKGTSTTTIQKNTLKVGYHEKLGPSSLVLLRAEIQDAAGNIVANSEKLNFMARQGFNVFSVSLCPDGLNLSDGSYKLVLFNLNGKKMELNFSYTRTNECE